MMKLRLPMKKAAFVKQVCFEGLILKIGTLKLNILLALGLKKVSALKRFSRSG